MPVTIARFSAHAREASGAAARALSDQWVCQCCDIIDDERDSIEELMPQDDEVNKHVIHEALCGRNEPKVKFVFCWKVIVWVKRTGRQSRGSTGDSVEKINRPCKRCHPLDVWVWSKKELTVLSLPQVGRMDRMDGFFASVASLMSQLLRTRVEASLRDLVALLEEYGDGNRYSGAYELFRGLALPTRPHPVTLYMVSPRPHPITLYMVSPWVHPITLYMVSPWVHPITLYMVSSHPHPITLYMVSPRVHPITLYMVSSRVHPITLYMVSPRVHPVTLYMVSSRVHPITLYMVSPRVHPVTLYMVSPRVHPVTLYMVSPRVHPVTLYMVSPRVHSVTLCFWGTQYHGPHGECH